MDAFAILGFVFGLMGFTTATTTASQLKKLEQSLADLRQRASELGGESPGESLECVSDDPVVDVDHQAKSFGGR